MAVDTKNVDYKPVNLAKNEVRLLEIQAGNDINDPINARLVNVRVTEDVEFIGLSALVGDLNDIEYMWINARKVSIPANIGEALRNVRAVFRRDSSSLYQVDSNASSQTTIPPLSPRNANNSNGNGHHLRNHHSNNKKQQPKPKNKTPGWLKHLLRGFQTLLPDQNGSNRGQGRETPLRVWLDCICLNQNNAKEEQHRRAHMALAYGSAKLVVGWLGPKDETTDLAVNNLRTMDALTPPEFGEPGDRETHPENYGPRMDFLRPLGEAWRTGNLSDPTKDPREGIFFKASENFLMRPFFHRQWILEEVASMSKFPAFLIGDEIVSWMQMLKYIRLSEEFKERGCVHLPDDVKIITEIIDIGTVHTLLEDFNRRRDKTDQRGLVKVSSSTASSVDSRHTQGTTGRPPTSQPRASKHLTPKYGI